MLENDNSKRFVADSEESLEHFVEQKQLVLLYSESFSTLVLGLIAACLGVFVLWTVADHNILVGWLIALTLLTMIRLGFTFLFFKQVEPDFKVWGRLYLWGTSISGCTWGVLIMVFDSTWSAPYQLFLWMLLVGIAAGAIGTNSYIKYAFPLFLLPILGGGAVFFLFQGESTYWFLAALAIIFVMQLIRTGHRYQRNILDTLRLRYSIQHMAYYDQLTKLPNRPLLDDRLGQLFAESKRDKLSFALLFLDLTKFKQVNDTYGHEIGDEVLKAVASRLTACIRESDTVARIGGDEFVVLLSNVADKDSAIQIAAKLFEAINRQIEVGELKLNISTSIGIALYPQHGEDNDTLVKHADMAMYQAKEGSYEIGVFDGL